MYKFIFYISLLAFSSYAISEELCYEDYNFDTKQVINICLDTEVSLNCIVRNNCALVVKYEVIKVSHPAKITVQCDTDISYTTAWPAGYIRKITQNQILSKDISITKKQKGGIVGLAFRNLNMVSDQVALPNYSCALYKPLSNYELD